MEITLPEDTNAERKEEKLTLKKILKILAGVGITIGLVGAGFGLNFVVRPEVKEDGTQKTVIEVQATMELGEETTTTLVENDRGEMVEETYPTVEEVDGGQFRDVNTGLSAIEGTYSDLGWAETYDVSSPQAFRNDTLGKCVIALNYFGAQCVSLARAYWWSYADRDVSTCGTGMAKGMMNCADENAGDDFVVYWKESWKNIQAGDWLVFDGGQYGHIGMALGEVTNGYVALLGENQGGASCGENVGGSATNIINISIKNLIGYYRPKAYIKPEPTPDVIPDASHDF